VRWPWYSERPKGFGPAVLLAALGVMMVTGAVSEAAPSTYATGLSSIVAAAIPPSNAAPPAVSATAQDGETFTASTGSWSGTPPFTYSYQWQRCNPGAVASQGTAPGQLESPEGIAVDPHGDTWVSDTYHGRLEVFSDGGNFLKTVGSEGSGPGQIGEPEGIAIDSKGHVWVADWRNDRVEEFSETGEYLQQFGSEGSGNGQLTRPYGIAVDSDGNVWVGDVGNNRVEEFSEHGEYVSQFGSRGSAPGQFGFSFPVGLAVNSNRDILVTDAEGNRLEEFNAQGEYLSEFGSEGSGNRQFRHPGDVVVDSSGNIWVVDQRNDRVAEFNANGEYQRQFGSTASGPGSLSSPDGVATDSNGDVWVADTGNSRIEEFNDHGEVVKHQACVNVAGATSPTYAVTAADLGSQVQVIVTATNSAGEASASGSSSPIIDEALQPPVSVSAPSIAGVTRERQTLSTSAGVWAGPEPISYAYQWQRCDSRGSDCADIAGATASTYALSHGDVATTVRVMVTATDSAGSTSASSAVTAIVAPLEPPVTIGVNDGSGWGPADAEKFVALGIKSERLEAPGTSGGSGSIAEYVKTSQSNGFTNDIVTVGNTPDTEPLSTVNISTWTAATVKQVEEAAENGVKLFEVGNEMFLKGPRCQGCRQQKEPVKYAEMFVSLSKAVDAAGITGVKLLFDSFGDYEEYEGGPWSQACCGGGWLATAERAEPELLQRVAGFTMHPYGEAGGNLENDWGPGALKVEHDQAVSLGFENTEYYATEFGVELDTGGVTGSSSPADQAEKIRAVYAELIGYGFVRGIWYYQTHDDGTGKWGLIEPQESGSSPFLPRPSLEVVSSFALVSNLALAAEY
jgi:sugar lactone lactonase YvrE